MTEFHVYENWTIDKAIVHEGACPYCNDGRGVQRRDSGKNGKWHGPFADRASAFKAATKLHRADTRACKVCKA